MIAATVGTIAEKIEASALDGPVLVMIGRVLASAIAQERSDEPGVHDALRSA
jgi:siroheme synthase